MSMFDSLLADKSLEARDAGGSGRFNGVFVGIVTNNSDPDKMGRVKVRFPWLSDTDESDWARVASPMAGKERGFYCLPEVDDEVLVAFERGDARFPYVLGALWNGKDAPPDTNDDEGNNVRVFKSRSGHVIRLSDKDGEEMIEIIDKGGDNRLVFDTKKNTVTISAGTDLTLSATQGKIKLAAKSVEIESSADTKIEAGGNMNIKGATVNIN
jgi:uncharacterized protein involved in type VI secretion and phage assembly